MIQTRDVFNILTLVFFIMKTILAILRVTISFIVVFTLVYDVFYCLFTIFPSLEGYYVKIGAIDDVNDFYRKAKYLNLISFGILLNFMTIKLSLNEEHKQNKGA